MTSPESIPVVCTACQQRILFPPKFAGRQVPCPTNGCEQLLAIPSAPSLPLAKVVSAKPVLARVVGRPTVPSDEPPRARRSPAEPNRYLLVVVLAVGIAGLFVVAAVAAGGYLLHARTKADEVAKSEPSAEPPNVAIAPPENLEPFPVPMEPPPAVFEPVSKVEILRAQLVGTWVSEPGQDGDAGDHVVGFDAAGKVTEWALRASINNELQLFPKPEFREGKVDYAIDANGPMPVVRIKGGAGLGHIDYEWTIASIDANKLTVSWIGIGEARRKVVAYRKIDVNPHRYAEKKPVLAQVPPSPAIPTSPITLPATASPKDKPTPFVTPIGEATGARFFAEYKLYFYDAGSSVSVVPDASVLAVRFVTRDKEFGPWVADDYTVEDEGGTVHPATTINPGGDGFWHSIQSSKAVKVVPKFTRLVGEESVNFAAFKDVSTKSKKLILRYKGKALDLQITADGVGGATASPKVAPAEVPKAVSADAPKLLGRWQLTGGPEGIDAAIEFAAAGVLVVEFGIALRTERLQGKYELAGDRLSFTIAKDGADTSTKLVVKKLTATELVLLEDGKTEQVFKRLPAIPKKK